MTLKGDFPTNTSCAVGTPMGIKVRGVGPLTCPTPPLRERMKVRGDFRTNDRKWVPIGWRVGRDPGEG